MASISRPISRRMILLDKLAFYLKREDLREQIAAAGAPRS